MFVTESSTLNSVSKSVAWGLMEVPCSEEWDKSRKLRKVKGQSVSLWLTGIIGHLTYSDIAQKLSREKKNCSNGVYLFCIKI